MSAIVAAVGERAPNRAADVSVVQGLLNLRIAAFDMLPLRTDGICDPPTIKAIRIFQVRCMDDRRADGRVDPNGRTMSALSATDPGELTRNRNMAAAARTRLSGGAWFDDNQAFYPNSNKLSDLAPVFSAHASSFVAALRAAQAVVVISATRRNKTRAWLMHYSWRLSKGEIAPADVPPDPECDIIWDHGSLQESRKAATEMVDKFAIAFRPSLTSRHISGTAIDMTISWSGPIEILDAAGRTHKLDHPRSGSTNTKLHEVGASYGVVKLLTDPPHWSVDGH